MSDGEALLRAVIEFPGEDAPRLIYADWCDENGQPDRAAYIRWNCKPHFRHPFPRVSYRRWFAPWWTGPTVRRHLMRDDVPTLWIARIRPTPADNSRNEMLVTRGFVSEVRIPADTWFARHPELTAAHPIERVRITTWMDRPEVLEDHYLEDRWPRITFALPQAALPPPFTAAG